MTNFKDFLEEQLKDDEIREEYEKLEQEMDEYKRKDGKELNSLDKKDVLCILEKIINIEGGLND